jgi:hypothetical protein
MHVLTVMHREPTNIQRGALYPQPAVRILRVSEGILPALLRQLQTNEWSSVCTTPDDRARLSKFMEGSYEECR